MTTQKLTTNARPDFPTGIDSSMLSKFKRCEKAFWYSYIRRLASPTASIHLNAGGAFAAGCEAFRKAYWRDGGHNWDEALYHGAVALIKHWGDYEPHPKETKTLDTMLVALAEYFTEHHPAHDPIQPYFSNIKGEVKPAVEINFALPLEGTAHPTTGEPILFTGRMDMIGVYNGCAYVVDEKTTSGIGPKWADQWKLRGQFTGYTWAAQQFGYPVVGVFVRGIALLKQSIRFASVPIQKQPWQIEQWHEQTVRDVNRMIEAWKTGQYNFDLSDACNSFGGCTFSSLCLSRDPEMWIPSQFSHNPWDPLKSFEEMREEKERMDSLFFVKADQTEDDVDIQLNPFG